MPLWGGVFNQPTDDLVRRLNDSLPFDWRLYDVDITGSVAWAGALQHTGMLTAGEHASIIKGLEQIRAEFSAGLLQAHPGDEDIHTAVERRLTELIGPVAGKLHTGRSRNDQVATDLRLWVMHNLPPLAEMVRTLQLALLEQAAAHLETLMPGFTHLQPAQPITAAHWLVSFVHMLDRDRKRLIEIQQEAAICPLGSGALAGTPYAIDRASLAGALGFSAPSLNSLDAVSDRDYVASFLFAAALLSAHLSRLAEDLILFSNPQFGYVVLGEAYSTGSSLMPQKRNPDPLELARGNTGRVIGHLTGLLTTLKGLPSGYNKDLQEDKEPLFDTVDTLTALLPVLAGLIRTMRLQPDAMLAGLSEAMLATDLADYLVDKGVPFRTAHHLAGQVVREAERQGCAMSALSIEDYRAISPKFDQDVYIVFDFQAAIRRRNVLGGPAPATVSVEIERLRAALES